MARHSHPKKHWLPVATAFSVVALGVTGFVAQGAGADSTGVEDFDGFTAGSPNGQNGWSSTGPYDHKIVTGYAGAPASFGDTSLRISNAVTSGSFGDQTFSE
jgi:hypothetical protein